MRLTCHMRTILAAVLADIRRLEAVPDRPSPGISRDQWREAWRERQELEQFGVRHDLARWLGYPPSPSDSAVFSRTLRQMEDLGLLVRVNRWGRRSATRVGRTTHVRLTPAGERLAEDVARDAQGARAAASRGGGVGDDAADWANPVFQPVPWPLDGPVVDGHGERTG